jgi:hypothetical protein
VAERESGPKVRTAFYDFFSIHARRDKSLQTQQIIPNIKKQAKNRIYGFQGAGCHSRLRQAPILSLPHVRWRRRRQEAEGDRGPGGQGAGGAGLERRSWRCRRRCIGAGLGRSTPPMHLPCDLSVSPFLCMHACVPARLPQIPCCLIRHLRPACQGASGSCLVCP